MRSASTSRWITSAANCSPNCSPRPARAARSSTSVGSGGSAATIDLDQLVVPPSARHRHDLQHPYRRGTRAGRGSALPDVLPALADGRIRPIVDSVFAFDDAHLARARLRSNQAIGKIVLEMTDD